MIHIAPAPPTETIPLAIVPAVSMDRPQSSLPGALNCAPARASLLPDLRPAESSHPLAVDSSGGPICSHALAHYVRRSLDAVAEVFRLGHWDPRPYRRQTDQSSKRTPRELRFLPTAAVGYASGANPSFEDAPPYNRPLRRSTKRNLVGSTSAGAGDWKGRPQIDEARGGHRLDSAQALAENWLAQYYILFRPSRPGLRPLDIGLGGVAPLAGCVNNSDK
ncbi:hypothetical protein ACVWZ4_001189 [Bradyrhizobium sp. USDA 4472]